MTGDNWGNTPSTTGLSTDQPRTFAVPASWLSLGLTLGGWGALFLFHTLDQAAPFDRTPQGLLTGFVPRTVLYLLWAGEALAVVAGGASFLLIRRTDITSKSLVGIVLRSLCGIGVGIFGTIFLWLIVGHTVIGF